MSIHHDTIQRSGRIVDVRSRRMFSGTITIGQGRIIDIVEEDVDSNLVILPGFVDAHVHVESSMIVPSEFARLAVVHGTVGTVSDPHEIANVLGLQGVRYMIDNGEKVPFHFAFGAPSCVPATIFETAGAEVTVDDIIELFKDDRVKYLSEMMNWPGTLAGDSTVLTKIAAAQAAGRPVDGHAPGLRGDDARRYAERGISTDHECFTLDEALDKVAVGMKILIREGSAARNYDALHPLLRTYPQHVMFCSDDMHPDSLVVGHINLLVRRSIALGYDVFDVLNAACIHPVDHYRLGIGTLRRGESADFIIVDNLQDVNVQETWIRGQLVAKNGVTNIARTETAIINNFDCQEIDETAIAVTLPTSSDARATGNDGVSRIRVIVAHDGQLVTSEEIVDNLTDDIHKIVVVNRYSTAQPAVAYIKGFGLTSGAIASSVAHDSHNVVAVGTTDADIVAAINAVIRQRGGVSISENGETDVLSLPVAGLMSTADGYVVAGDYARLDAKAKGLGSPLRAPFMTLSFMALLVIPQLKLSDKGLFDGATFRFADVFVQPDDSENPA